MMRAKPSSADINPEFISNQVSNIVYPEQAKAEAAEKCMNYVFSNNLNCMELVNIFNNFAIESESNKTEEPNLEKGVNPFASKTIFDTCVKAEILDGKVIDVEYLKNHIDKTDADTAHTRSENLGRRTMSCIAQNDPKFRKEMTETTDVGRELVESFEFLFGL